MADFDDIELAGLTEAQLEELSEFIDPDVSRPQLPAGLAVISGLPFLLFYIW